MKWFQRFYLDKEKDIIVDLYRDDTASSGDPCVMHFVLSTPNHGTGNLIRNLAATSTAITASSIFSGWETPKWPISSRTDAWR